MNTLSQAIEHAANHDELDEKILMLFQASTERNLVVQQTESLKAYMEASAVYMAKCEKAIREIDNILTESTKYLASRKDKESKAKQALDNMMLDGVSFPSFGVSHA